MRQVNLSTFLNFGRPLFFGGGGGGSPQSPPDTPLPVREDTQGASEQAARSQALKKGMRQTILAQAADPNATLGGQQTILGQAQQSMYGTP